MGLGERKKRGGRFGRRRNRRITDKEPGFGVRRRSRSSGRGFLFCCGALKDPCARNQEDILALHQAQEHILLSFKQQPNLDQDNSLWHASHDQERREKVEELQNEQIELFNDIVEQYYNEKDQDAVQELFRQHFELIEQMQELQAAGYAYSMGIPSAIDVSKRKDESVDTTSADIT